MAIDKWVVWLTWREAVAMVAASYRCDEREAVSKLRRAWQDSQVRTDGATTRPRFFRKDVERIRPDRTPAAVVAPSTVQASPEAPSKSEGKSRLQYKGDLVEFMARKGIKLLERPSPKEIARLYIDDHERRAATGRDVPELPAKSNRIARIAKQVVIIRDGMAQEVAQRTGA